MARCRRQPFASPCLIEVQMAVQWRASVVKELHIDRAYLSSHSGRERSDELEAYYKVWPVRKGKHFHKQAFALDWNDRSSGAQLRRPDFSTDAREVWHETSSASCHLSTKHGRQQSARRIWLSFLGEARRVASSIVKERLSWASIPSSCFSM